MFNNAHTECSVKKVDTVIIYFDIKKSINFGINQILCKIVSDSQLFVDKTMFLEKKAHFFGSKTVDQRFGANLKKPVFCRNLLQISANFLLF